MALNTSSEPVTITAAATAAVNSTLGILALAFHWPANVSSGLFAASGAWIVLFAIMFARPNVTPNNNVALTQDENKIFQMAKEEAKVKTPNGVKR